MDSSLVNAGIQCMCVLISPDENSGVFGVNTHLCICGYGASACMFSIPSFSNDFPFKYWKNLNDLMSIGGRLVYHYRKKKPSPARCGDTGVKLKGVSRPLQSTSQSKGPVLTPWGQGSWLWIPIALMMQQPTKLFARQCRYTLKYVLLPATEGGDDMGAVDGESESGGGVVLFQ